MTPSEFREDVLMLVKLEWSGYRMVKKTDNMLSCFHRNVTDGQTNGQTLATLRWLVYRPTYWIASSRFSTLQLGRSPVYVAQITSLTLLPVFTGFVLLSASISNWRSLYTELCTALRYLSDLRRVADLPSRRLLRSATSSQLDVRPSRLVTVGDRLFGYVGPKLWNSLPDDITSLPVFRKKLKTHLFQQSYLDVIL